MKIKTIGIVGLGAVALLLAGCSRETSPESQQGTNGVVSTFYAKTIDGRTIPCVVWSGYKQGGLSCDWSYK